MNIAGGAAIPVVVVTDAKVEGITARPVYGYQAKPTDRPVTGGKARRVKVIAAADLRQNGGQYILSGEPLAMPVYTDPSGETDGGVAMAVYPINAWPTTSAATPWYLSGGIALANCLVAHQAKGAASLAASYVNLAHPGTNDAQVGSAPTFDTATGWTFNANEYLYSLVPVAGYSMIVQFSQSPATQGGGMCGMEDGISARRINIYPNYTGGVSYYRDGGALDAVAGGYASGNACVTPAKGYKNGLPHGALVGSWSGVTIYAIGIGKDNYSGNYLVNPWTGTISAFAIYNITLSDPQVAALATAMAAL